MFSARGRRKWLGGVLGGFVLVQPLPGVAAEGVWFSDDFETGTLKNSDLPAGGWDTAAVTSPNTFAIGEAGAHRGRFGLTVSDRTTHMGSMASASVEKPALTEEFHVRGWLRLRAASPAGSLVIMQALPALVELRLQEPGPHWELSVMNGSGRTYLSRHGSRMEPDRWHLVEFSARGLGTADGEARLWVDGVEQGAPLSRLDLRHTDNVLKRFVVGEPWSDTGTFTGTIDFDDVRVSAAPLASRLELRTAETAASSCLAVDVSLRSSTGEPAPAPYETDVALAITAGEGGFHAEKDCDSPVASLRLPPGASERRVYFRPGGTEGVARVAASHPDFLSATLSVEGRVDPDDDGSPWTSDLGCTSASGALGALPVLLVPWIRRRSGRPARRCPVD